MQINVTEKNLADTVPVARVPTFLKFVPHVRTNEVVPDVVIKNVTLCPATPPLALNVHAPVGVIVIMEEVMFTVIAPVVALVAADTLTPPKEKGRTLITFVVRSIEPASIAFVTVLFGIVTVPVNAGEAMLAFRASDAAVDAASATANESVFTFNLNPVVNIPGIESANFV